MSRYWSPRVRQLSPYVPGEQPKQARLVKLNTNENPYGPSPRVVEALQKAASGPLQRYPDPEATQLKQAIANEYQLQPEQVFVGNGSDEVLAHTWQALFQPDQPLLFPDISYGFYPTYCKLFGITAQTIPLNADLAIDPADYQQPNGGIIFPNPNAPTGHLLALEQIEALLQRNTDSVVVVDEAYVDFGGESAAPLVSHYPNLLVVQTFSKSRSLAGLRVGFALGDAALIEGLERVKNSFNSYPLDQLAITGAIAAIEDRAHFEQTRRAVIQSREKLAGALKGLGFDVIPSAANFLFVTHAERPAAELHAALRERAIIVRYFDKPRIDNFLRITVGTEPECEQLAEALTQILNSPQH